MNANTSFSLTKNQRRSLRNDLLMLDTRKAENVAALNDLDLLAAHTLEEPRINEKKAEKAAHDALIAIRVAERAAQQKEEARREHLHTEKMMLRAKRESAEKSEIMKFVNRGFVPPAKIGPTQDQIEQLEIIEELEKTEKDIAAKAAVLRNPRLSQEERATTEVAYANAVRYRNGIKSATPKELRRRIDLNFYLKHTVRNVTGSASFQK